MTEQEFNELREISWRRPLDAAEDARIRAYLALNPAAQRDWELDAELTQLLEQVPNVPLPSNFTYQVLAALDRETTPLPSQAATGASWPRWLQNAVPRLAGALALVSVLGLLAYQRYKTDQQEQLTQALLQVTHANGLNQPGIFQDFDVIQRLGKVPQPADEELWMVLSQTQP